MGFASVDSYLHPVLIVRTPMLNTTCSLLDAHEVFKTQYSYYQFAMVHFDWSWSLSQWRDRHPCIYITPCSLNNAMQVGYLLRGKQINTRHQYDQQTPDSVSRAEYPDDSNFYTNKTIDQSKQLPRPYLISMHLTSKTSELFGGIDPVFLLPYARCAGMVILRSPPVWMPCIPISQPLITSPEPSVNRNGGPFLFATGSVSMCIGV